MIKAIGQNAHPSLQLTSLRYDSKQIKLSRLHPDMIQDNLQLVHKYILNQVLEPGQKAQLKIRIVGDKAVVDVIGDHSIGHKEIILPQKKVESLSTQIRQSADYARRMEPRIKAPHPLRKKSREAIRKAKEGSKITPLGHVATSVDVAAGVYSVVRQGMSARFLEGGPAFRLNCAGFGSAFFWTAGYGYEFYNGWKDRKRFEQVGDLEGTRRAYANMFSGATGVTASLMYAAGKGVETAIDPMCAAAWGITYASTVFFGAGAIASMGISGAGIYRCRTFRNDLDKYAEHPSLPEHEKLAGAIRFLRSKLIVTDGEIVKMKRELGFPVKGDLTPEQQVVFDEKFEKATQVKINEMKRRSSVNSMMRILRDSEAILSDLQSPNTRAKAVQAAQELIESVKSDSRKKELLHWITLLATVIFFIGYVAGCFLSAGILPALCFAIASGILLATTLYRLYKRYSDRHLQIDLNSLRSPSRASA